VLVIIIRFVALPMNPPSAFTTTERRAEARVDVRATGARSTTAF
jgi:hypothetical protein